MKFTRTGHTFLDAMRVALRCANNESLIRLALIELARHRVPELDVPSTAFEAPTTKETA